MNEPDFVGPKWHKPAPLGYANALDSLASVAAPLLAGFSLASVVVVSENPGNFRWPGGAIVALTAAAVLLIGTVQCGFNGRQYLWSAADVLAWWPEMTGDTELEDLLSEEQAEAFKRWEVWSRWTRATYNSGILAFIAALVLVLPPQHSNGTQDNLRWAATGIAFVAWAAEVIWLLAGLRRRSLEARRDGI